MNDELTELRDRIVKAREGISACSDLLDALEVGLDMSDQVLEAIAAIRPSDRVNLPA